MDLTELSGAIRLAALEANRPPAEGETRPFSVPVEHLDEDGLALLWEAAHALRQRAPELAAALPQTRLANLIVDELVAHPDLDIAGLASALRVHAANEGPWLVETWLMHAEMRTAWTPLGDGAALLRAAPDRHSERSDEEIDAQFAVFKWVGARITPPVRLLHLNGSSAPFDTTRTAVMVTRETGIDSLAKTAARARAQYAVAAWTVLQPPAQYQLIPDVGTWTPQPFLQLSQQHRPTSETPSFAEAGPTGSMRGHSPYVLPDERVLRIPFTAMENLDRRSAQAALSASLQHLSAARASRLLPSERIRALLAGMESLGEPSQGHANGIQRFKKLVSAHGLWGTAASRGWDEQRLRDAIGRMRRARNIATHGADASLLDLGYPVGVQRPMRHELAMGHELATGALLSDLEVLIHLLGRTLAAVFEVQSANSWDDSVFERACR